jgi:hypothetical protein
MIGLLQRLSHPLRAGLTDSKTSATMKMHIDQFAAAGMYLQPAATGSFP